MAAGSAADKWSKKGEEEEEKKKTKQGVCVCEREIDGEEVVSLKSFLSLWFVHKQWCVFRGHCTRTKQTSKPARMDVTLNVRVSCI